MSYQTIIFEKKEGVGLITMNLPKSMNALEQALLDDLTRVTREIEGDESVKAVILTGTGKAFCAGGDIRRFIQGFTATSALDYLQSIHVFSASWSRLKVPTIAAVNGVAAGAGLTLSILCDLIIAAESAKFSASFINIGLIPDLGLAYYLPRIVGLIRAKDIMYTGRMLESGEARDIGLVTRLVPDDKLAEESFSQALKFAKGPSFGLRATKNITNSGLSLDIAAHLNLEAHLQSMCFQTEDAAEAVRAFLEKRKPSFKGK
jgi:2-(1,2-epoxy-1,2-dihydrophenyl)acetyl-CoA isomerase